MISLQDFKTCIFNRNCEEIMADKKYKSVPLHPSEITPERLYLSRRKFMKIASVAGVAAALAACGVKPAGSSMPETEAVGSATQSIDPTQTTAAGSGLLDDLGDAASSFEDIVNFNNFYEFTTNKEQVAELSRNFITSPWELKVGGLVNNPKTFNMDDIFKLFEQEERIYRLRCVEGWSMVIPWSGFPISKLLNEVEPTEEAKYLVFETLARPSEMPGLEKNSYFPWPYIEGLRLDEAMNDLAILATGLYGKELLPQSGAPIRLVVPWKYGFKSIKSIIRMDLVSERPAPFWVMAAANEYGFYANVNPEVPHPRWSQATERRIGELGRRETLMFNGYAEEVAHLYEGMDLSINF